ncbi:MAG: M14 family metallopeptidase [Chloroflexota bacterium]
MPQRLIHIILRCALLLHLLSIGMVLSTCTDGQQMSPPAEETTITARMNDAIRPYIPRSIVSYVEDILFSQPPEIPADVIADALGQEPTGVLHEVLGMSTNGHPIDLYTFRSSQYVTSPTNTRVVFVGGIHGGYEWNTIALAYKAIDYFREHVETIPPTMTIQIIPSANPDGQVLVTGVPGRFEQNPVGNVMLTARFNGNGVDLNRNWDCNWAQIAYLGNVQISGGDAPFSEVETQILRDFLVDETQPRPQAVIFWHSAAPGVFAGGCPDRYPAADALGRVYAQASGYPYQDLFTGYPVTGDATDWLSTQGIPAIVVELETHGLVEWEQNLRGMVAVIETRTPP